jgi:DNA repair protein RadA/Sms
MARLSLSYRCSGCGTPAPKWVGRCPSCDEWNTLVEEVEEVPRRGTPVAPGSGPGPVVLADVDPDAAAVRSTGIGELDRVLGGGLVPGSATLVGGEPGVGKSTLLLQALIALAADGATCLLVSAEESAAQVRARAGRLPRLPPGLLLLSETALPHILSAIESVAPDVCVVDSIQTIWDPEVGSSPGSVTQVKECAQALVRSAKERSMACLLVGHVTKDGALAGPRLLEHVVDTVLSFEGDRHHALRLLRAVKHRFGPTDELGLFEMTDTGMVGVPDASAMLLGDRRPSVAGSVVVPALVGRRPLLVEVQALVTGSFLTSARRSAQGLDSGRLSVLVAVMDQRLGLSLVTKDVYVSAVGGVRVVEPAADLAVALAILSAQSGKALPRELVVCGEIGLGGELRQVQQTPRRLAEAARLGFTKALVPASTGPGPDGMEMRRVSTLTGAALALGLSTATRPWTAGRETSSPAITPIERHTRADGSQTRNLDVLLSSSDRKRPGRRGRPFR